METAIGPIEDGLTIHIEPARLAAIVPIEVIACLTGWRQLIAFKRMLSAKRTEEGGEQLAKPVHPLLLCTALGLAIVDGRDPGSFVQMYTDGGVGPPLEDQLLHLDPNAICPNQRLAQVLESESRFFSALTVLGAAYARDWGGIVPGTPAISRFDAYFGAWMVVNPAFRMGPNTRLAGWQSCMIYSWSLNSRIHNAREHHEYALVRVIQELNQVLATRHLDGRAERLAELQSRHRLLTLLIKRARLQYELLPHELSVHHIMRFGGAPLDTIEPLAWLQLGRGPKGEGEGEVLPEQFEAAKKEVLEEALRSHQETLAKRKFEPRDLLPAEVDQEVERWDAALQRRVAIATKGGPSDG
jgi:hypothetical protein